MPTSSSSWRNSTLKLYVLVFRNHLSYLQEQFSESCLTATNPIPHSLLCLLFAKKKKSGRGTGQIGTEKSNSAFSCLRFLELHVADEQLNNQEKAQFPLGSRVKLRHADEEVHQCTTRYCAQILGKCITDLCVHLLPSPKMGFDIEYIKAFNPEYFKGYSVTTNHCRRLTS